MHRGLKTQQCSEHNLIPTVWPGNVVQNLLYRDCGRKSGSGFLAFSLDHTLLIPITLGTAILKANVILLLP